MSKRHILFVGLAMLLVACSTQLDTTPEVTAEATSEITAEATASLELTQTYTFDLGWGGQVAFDYPASWDVRNQNSLGIYGAEGYTITLSADNNPATNTDAQSQLDRLNQSNDILTTEVNGVTIYYSYIPMSKRYTATIQLDDETYGVLQFINTRSQDFEPMLDTFFEIASSMRVVE